MINRVTFYDHYNNKEELLNNTANLLYEYLKRTKAVKEIVSDAKKEIEGLKDGCLSL